MTRPAQGAILLAVATALGEAALQALVTTDWSSVVEHALLFAFLIGPLLFLALLVWRRREHATRSRVLFVVTVLIAIGGLGALGYNLHRFNTDVQFRVSRNMSGLIVPLVQWGVVMVIWLWLVIEESRDKRATKQAAQTVPVSGSPKTTNPSQSS